MCDKNKLLELLIKDFPSLARAMLKASSGKPCSVCVNPSYCKGISRAASFTKCGKPERRKNNEKKASQFKVISTYAQSTQAFWENVFGSF